MCRETASRTDHSSGPERAILASSANRCVDCRTAMRTTTMTTTATALIGRSSPTGGRASCPPRSRGGTAANASDSSWSRHALTDIHHKARSARKDVHDDDGRAGSSPDSSRLHGRVLRWHRRDERAGHLSRAEIRGIDEALVALRGVRSPSTVPRCHDRPDGPTESQRAPESTFGLERFGSRREDRPDPWHAARSRPRAADATAQTGKTLAIPPAPDTHGDRAGTQCRARERPAQRGTRRALEVAERTLVALAAGEANLGQRDALGEAIDHTLKRGVGEVHHGDSSARRGASIQWDRPLSTRIVAPCSPPPATRSSPARAPDLTAKILLALPHERCPGGARRCVHCALCADHRAQICVFRAPRLTCRGDRPGICARARR